MGWKVRIDEVLVGADWHIEDGILETPEGDLLPFTMDTRLGPGYLRAAKGMFVELFGVTREATHSVPGFEDWLQIRAHEGQVVPKADTIWGTECAPRGRSESLTCEALGVVL